MATSNSKLLKHGNEIYTIKEYLMFEGEFKKFAYYLQECVIE